MLRLIVFDCDGVMFDSRRANLEYYNQLLRHFGHPQMDDNELEYVHMHNAPDSVRHIFRHYPEDRLEDVERYRKELGYDGFLQYMHMEEDLVDFLELAGKQFHLAISTNRANTMMPLLRIFNLEGYFGKVVTSETAARPKPAPDGLLEIMDYFNCTPQETIFIGDSIIDHHHAKSCNVPLIAFKSPDLTADYHVSCFMEIFRLPPFAVISKPR